MKMDDILHECIERMARGETLEGCLARFPKESQKLEPLLRISQRLLALKVPEAQPQFKARALQRALAAIPREETRRAAARWLPRWATALAVVAVVVLGGGGAAVAYSGNSLPGEPLYPVKQQKERVQLFLTSSQAGKAKLNARFANTRLNEVGALMAKGKVEMAQKTLARFNKHMQRSAAQGKSVSPEVVTTPPPTPQTEPWPRAQGQPEKPPQPSVAKPAHPEPPGKTQAWPRGQGQSMKELQAFLKTHQVRNERQLQQVLNKLPPQERARMMQIILEVRDTYQEAIETLGGP